MGLIGSFVSGAYTQPGITRGMGLNLGFKLASSVPTLGFQQTDTFVQSCAVKNQAQLGVTTFGAPAPVMTLPSLYEIDNAVGYTLPVLDGMVAGGRIGVMTILGALAAFGAASVGLPTSAAMLLGGSGLLTEVGIDGAIGIRAGVLSRRIIDRLVKTDDSSERERLFTALLEFMGPTQILKRLQQIFFYTNDIEVARRVIGPLYSFCYNYARGQVNHYADSTTGFSRIDGELDRSRDYDSQLSRRRQWAWEQMDSIVRHHSVTRAYNRFYKTLRRGLASWNPRSWLRPLWRMKRALLPAWS